MPRTFSTRAGGTRGVVLAAGAGSRLDGSTAAPPKPLAPIAGRPLIFRTLDTLTAASVRDIAVVLGHRAREVERELAREAWPAARVRTIRNDDYAAGNAASLGRAYAAVRTPFLLVMADHLLQRDIVLAVLAGAGQRCRLAVDRDTRNESSDDATRALVRDGRVIDLGKSLREWNAIDTGVFWCTADLARAMPSDRRHAEVAAVFAALARAGALEAVDVTGHAWLDVDTPADIARAEAMVADGRPLGGPVSRYLNRRLSIPAARLLARTPVTPNSVSVAALLLALAAMAFLALGRNIEAGVLIQASSVVDGVDGDLARAKATTSRFGGLFDAVLDRYADAAIAGGMAWYALSREDWPQPLLAGLAAAVGFLAVSYSRARLESSGRAETAAALRGVASRDVRLLVLAAGAVVGQAYWALVICGTASYATVAWRLWAFRTRTPAVRTA
jgi:CDP-L-myo-inositol myo-inositolphosphotransferase